MSRSLCRNRATACSTMLWRPLRSIGTPPKARRIGPSGKKNAALLDERRQLHPEDTGRRHHDECVPVRRARRGDEDEAGGLVHVPALFQPLRRKMSLADVDERADSERIIRSLARARLLIILLESALSSTVWPS